MIIDDNVSKIEKKLEICCLKPTPKKICDEFYLNKDNNKNKNINIGIENVIHVNINLLKSNYFMDDVIVGKIKIIKSELQLNGIFLEIKKEEKINLQIVKLWQDMNWLRVSLKLGMKYILDII